MLILFVNNLQLVIYSTCVPFVRETAVKDGNQMLSAPKPVVGREIALRLLQRCLRPVAHFCLRHGLRLQDLVECAKGELVRAARIELETQGMKGSTSRVSIATGVHRADVDRVSSGAPPSVASQDFVTRLMGHWQSSPQFLSRSGKPRVLSIGDENSEFSQLVRAISKEPNPGTILTELRRLGLIEDTKGGIALQAASNVAPGDPEAGFNVLASDVHDLTRAVEENVLSNQAISHFHARTEFDNVRPEALEELRRLIVREGHKFHSEMRAIIGAADQDINPQAGDKGSGVRVVVGAFSFVEEQPTSGAGKNRKDS